MPFWSRSKEEPAALAEKSLNFSDDSMGGSSFGSGADDALMTQSSAMGDLQEFSMALRQQIMIQQVINTLTDKAFEKCITGKPGDDGLTGKEVGCVNAVVCKWLDTNEFMNGRIARKMGGGGQM
jgi:hypothetical protein